MIGVELEAMEDVLIGQDFVVKATVTNKASSVRCVSSWLHIQWNLCIVATPWDPSGKLAAIERWPVNFYRISLIGTYPCWLQ